jgi:hypothetical protein
LALRASPAPSDAAVVNVSFGRASNKKAAIEFLHALPIQWPAQKDFNRRFRGLAFPGGAVFGANQRIGSCLKSLELY